MAFCHCLQLTNVALGRGLKKIGWEAFFECFSLQHIVIPQSIKVINPRAFMCCLHLVTVELCAGPEEIGWLALAGCTLLQKIIIPQSVKVIHTNAFYNCTQLTNVQFCEEIEDFVSGESMRDWWNHGVHEKSLSTYCFFAQYIVPERVRLVQARKWQSNIHDMLWRIPSVSPNALSAYFDSINSKLSVYKIFRDTPMLLELAIWKSTVTMQYDGNTNLLTANMKLECRNYSLAMVGIMVPNVLSFLMI